MSRPTNQIEKIYEEYFQEITKYLYRRTGNVETAKDLAQDVFIKALHGLSSFKGHSSIKTWLYTIAYHTFVNDYRRKVKRTFTDVEKADFLEQQIFMTPEAHLETQAEIQRLWSHINQLKDSYREVLILRDIQELSYEEVAEILNWTLSKVKTTLHRARLELKRKLHCEEFNK
ncbi:MULTISPECIES: sigma-70 family RNA polymerase sigma factor [Bacillus]|nr:MULTISPECIES: sigma-70 family RNA polymerase sigma factor [Bacillus]MBV5111155.1 sigma-70 family RNA polymerase sigma factor [Bacillus altitudinis]MBW2728267.1 sigma-70 family RNA polymerase sigma factor [Bacillus altitudinis]MDJ0285564.1 sigma-70 family RNA polymerase sigma factor [Bacillus altitudinis]